VSFADDARPEPPPAPDPLAGWPAFAQAVLRRLDAIAAAVGVPAADGGPPQPAEEARAPSPQPVGRLRLAPEVLELLGDLSAALGRSPGDVVRLALGALVRELERGGARPDGGPRIVAPNCGLLADVPQLALPPGAR
jgi:hypothetical protein